MIRNLITLFVPPVLKNYFLLPTQHLTLSFQDLKIAGVVTKFYKKSISAESYIEEWYDESTKQSVPNQQIAALRSFLKKTGSFDSVSVVIPSSLIFFKELTVPFTDQEKIDLIVPYELEPILPFPLSEASFDYIITQQDIAQNNATIMISAIKKSIVQEYESLCYQAGLTSASYTTDIIDVAQMYMHYINNNDLSNVIAIDSDGTSIKILLFHNRLLKNVRTIKTAIKNNLLPEKAAQDIVVTLQPFLETLTTPEKTSLLLSGPCASLIQAAIEKILPLPNKILSLQDFVTVFGITINKNISLNNLSCSLFASALSPSFEKQFSLSLEKPTPFEKKQETRSLTISIIFSLCILISISIHMFTTIARHNQEEQVSREEIFSGLKSAFPSIKTKNIKTLLDNAQKEVKKEEALWSSFSTDTRTSFLSYLQTLSTEIDREALGLSLKKMTISKNFIFLEGSVRDFIAVDRFENQLKKTNLFTKVPDMQDVDFSFTLPLAPKGVS